MSTAAPVRTDGRPAAMMRQLKSERGLLTRADGSARWEQDGSVVLAAVHGPRTIPARKEQPEMLSIEVNVRPASGVQSSAEKEAEMVLRRTLEQVVLTAMHPRLGVTVVVQVVSADGSIDACAANAACAALIDAGVPMRGPVVDPTADEERVATGLATLSYCFRGGQQGETPPMALPEAEAEVLQTTSRGVMSEEDFLGLVVLGRDAAHSVFEFFREAVRRFHERTEAEMEEIRKGAGRVKDAGKSGGFRKSFGAPTDGADAMEAAA